MGKRLPTVDAEFCALIPPLTSDERGQLQNSIKAEGCRDALVLWEGKNILLDGHNRLEICRELGVSYDMRNVKIANRSAAKEWIIRNQFSRRNLTTYQRCELALQLKPLIAERAKEKQRESGGAVPQKSAKAVIDTREELAKVAGVSHDTIHKAEVIAKKGSREVKDKLQRLELSINAAYHVTVGPHIGFATGENEWYTPPEYIEAARKVMGDIDCDPASSALANKTVKAKRFYTKQDDGLTKRWGKRVWVNPPYAQPLMDRFARGVAERFMNDEIEQACVLVNNATETAWFQFMLEVASAACFVKGRIRFVDQRGNASGAPLQGQAVLYLGKRVQAFKAQFGKLGIVLIR